MRARVALAALLLVAGCSSSGGSSDPLGLPTKGGGSGGGGTGGGGTTGTAAQARYGYGAKTSGVDYQSGVVVVGGGPASVRGASADGLTWTLSRSASGVAGLQVGKVMLVTSKVAGRVVALHDEGDSRVVTIAPVPLTAILRNGDIDIRQAIDSRTVTYQPVPGLGVGTVTLPKGAGSSVPSGTHSFRNGAGAGGKITLAAATEPMLPPPVKFEGTVPVGPFEIKPSYSSNGELGATVEYTGPGGLKLNFSVTFTTNNLQVSGNLHIHDGSAAPPTLRITGITGMQLSVGAGAANGSVDNGKFKIELPGEFEVPLPPSPATAGLPLTLTLKYKLLVETALVGKNSTVLGSGEYKLDGPIGVDAGTLLKPSLTVEKSLVDSISGISIGPSGVVVAMNITTQLGVGPPLLNAGPSTGITVSVGVTNGSALGASLVRCHGATLDLVGSFGLSVNIDPTVASLLKHVLPTGTKLEIGTEVTSTLLERTVVVPNVPACH